MDLNPYVYDAFRAAIKQELNEIMTAFEAMQSNDNTLDMNAMLDMCQDVIEHHVECLSEVTDD